MMKKLTAIMFLMLLMLLCLSSCEYSNEVVSISIVQYPNRLFYVVGENELDFQGCLIAFTSRSGNVAVSDLFECINIPGNNTYSIEEDVDFNKAGIYVVKITSEGFECQFPVQVISKESLQILILMN